MVIQKRIIDKRNSSLIQYMYIVCGGFHNTHTYTFFYRTTPENGVTKKKLPHLYLVIIKGSGGVSTGALFKSLRLPVEHPDTDGALAAIQKGDVSALAPLCENALEPPATALLPEIAENKRQLMQNGALSAFMTGSGAAVVGLFPNESAAQQAAQALSHLPFVCVCHSL